MSQGEIEDFNKVTMFSRVEDTDQERVLGPRAEYLKLLGEK